MPTTIVDLGALRTDETFMTRVAAVVGVVAAKVLAEAENVTYHEDRVAWARVGAVGARQYADGWFWAIVGHAGIVAKVADLASITDADLQTGFEAALNSLVRIGLPQFSNLLPPADPP